MAPLTRTVNNLRAATALAPARPAYAAGLRAALATVAPLVIAQILHLASGGTWMSLAGFNGALVDRGGAYHTRAQTMTLLTLACAVAVVIGTLGSTNLVVAVALTFVVALACSLGRAWGLVGASIGGSVLNTFVIALAFPAATLPDALGRAGFISIGGVWAMLVALVLWPLRPYRPARLAVAAGYRALANYIDEIARALRESAPEIVASPATVAAVRAALENARAVLATMRRGRGESGRSEKLVVLREIADQMFGLIVALRDTVDLVPRDRRNPGVQATLTQMLETIAATARAIADNVEEEDAAQPISIPWQGDELRTAVTDAGMHPDTDVAAAHYVQAAVLFDRLAQFAGVGAATAITLNKGGPAPALDGILEVQDPDAPQPFLAPLRDVLSWNSLVLGYALRVAIVCAIAVCLTSVFDLKRGYWVTITVVIILQPYTGATSQKALQRVLGTVLGGILTAALGALFHDSQAILVLAFIFAATSVALLPLNYAVFSIFLTPTFVLLAEASAGDWHLAELRIMNTLLGGALALLGARLLWPSPERSRLPTYMANALRANRAYLGRAVALFGDRSERAGRMLREARRDTGLAATNAEESFDRFLGEYRGPPEDLAPIMTFLTYTRRLTATTAALSVLRHSVELEQADVLGEFGRIADEVLLDLADAVVSGRRPKPLPVQPEPPGDQLLRARVNRLARQLKTLHDAIDAWSGHHMGGLAAVG